MASRAAEKLLDQNLCHRDDIDLVIYFHTLATSIPYNGESIPTKLCERFALKKAHGFSLAQQNCVSFMMALKVVQQLMAYDESLNNVLIVGADKVLDEGSRNIEIMQMESDGAAAALVQRGCNKNKVLSIECITHGEYFAGVGSQTSANANTHRMMFLILNRLIRRSVEGIIDLDEINAILPHNVNPPGLQQVVRSLRLSKEILFDECIAENGHNFGCDNIINLQNATDRGFVSAGDHAVLTAIGFGRTYGCMLLKI